MVKEIINILEKKLKNRRITKVVGWEGGITKAYEDRRQAMKYQDREPKKTSE